MISNETFVLALGVFLAGLALWAFKRLPCEDWQILASIPILKNSGDRWHGLNLTYYGLLTANALVFGVAILIILLGALHVPATLSLALIAAVLLICLPAARAMARLVEGKSFNFTVAGAFFVGIFAAPAMLKLFNSISTSNSSQSIPLLPALAAIMVAYAFGEGLGRLACISFGCCYGKSLAEVRPIVRKIFGSWHFVFSGKMKKISYASNMDGKQVVPIQAITAVFYITTGLLSTLLFLRGDYALSLIIATAVTQGWRAVSETLRADYRGEGNITAYQAMAVAAISWTASVAYTADSYRSVTPDLYTGLETIWHPAVLLSLQALWAIVFLFFGKSMVTGAEISFHLYHDRI
jgi:hypothetical protein